MKIVSLILHILVGFTFIIAELLPIVTGGWGLLIMSGAAGMPSSVMMSVYSMVIIGSICFFAAAVSIVFGVVAFIRNKRGTFYTIFEIINSIYGMVSAVSFAFSLFVLRMSRTGAVYMLGYLFPILLIITLNLITLAFAIINRIRAYNEPEEDEDGYAYSSQDGMRYDSQYGAQYGVQYGAQPGGGYAQLDLQADPGDEYSR